MADNAFPVWARPEAFDELPSHFPPYGYINRQGEPVGFDSFEDLFKTVEEDPTQGIAFVWTPQQSHLITPEEVPELFSAVKSFRQAATRDNFLDARRNVLLFGAVGAFMAYQAWRGDWVALLKNQNVVFGLILLVMLGVMPLYQAWKELRRARALTPEAMAEDAPAVRFEIWLARQKAEGTRRLLAALIVVGVVQLFDVLVEKDVQSIRLLVDGVMKIQAAPGYLAEAGILKPLRGEWWRLLTGPFLHGGILHFFFNFMALRYLGRRVEVLGGWQHMMGSFLVSMLVGGVASVLLVDLPSVGASGGLCGLLGFLIVFETQHPRLVPRSARRRLLGAAIGLVVLGFIGISLIDNAAHAGGLFAGMGYAWVVFPKSSSPLRPHPGSAGAIWGFLALTVLLLGVVVTVLKVA